jgi:hypothetical protein
MEDQSQTFHVRHIHAQAFTDQITEQHITDPVLSRAQNDSFHQFRFLLLSHHVTS